MTHDQIIDAFLIPLAWETVNGDQKAAWPYAVTRHPLFGATWVAYRFGVPLADEVNGGVALFSNEADAIAACEADHRAEAVKTWDLAKIEALVGAVTDYHLSLDRREHGGIAGSRLVDAVQAILGMPWRQGAALATIRGRT